MELSEPLKPPWPPKPPALLRPPSPPPKLPPRPPPAPPPKSPAFAGAANAMAIATVAPAIICLLFIIIVLLLSRRHPATFTRDTKRRVNLIPSHPYLLSGRCADQTEAICQIPAGWAQIDCLFRQGINGGRRRRPIGSR